MECWNIIVDGTSIYLIIIFMERIFWLKLLEPLPKLITKIFLDIISCKEDKFRKLFIQGLMIIFLLSSKWNWIEFEEIIGTMLPLSFMGILMLSWTHFYYKEERQSKYWLKIFNFINFFLGNNFLCPFWQSNWNKLGREWLWKGEGQLKELVNLLQYTFNQILSN